MQMDVDRIKALAAPFPAMVAEEIASARRQHKPINSTHEGYSVILEELDEFWQEVKKKSRDRDRAAMLRELVQLGAMAQRCAEDTGLAAKE